MVKDGVTTYTDPPLPENLDDWRRDLVRLKADLSGLTPGLADAIYLADGI
jgi:hypothetical protein